MKIDRRAFEAYYYLSRFMRCYQSRIDDRHYGGEMDTMKEGASRYVPADRAPRDVIARQGELVLDLPLLRQLYDAVTEIVVILNKERQIVFSNKGLAQLLGVDDQSKLYGLRPGEALDCVHAAQSAGGCGTTDYCAACGALGAILASQEGEEETRESRFLRNRTGDALDLLVRASPLDIRGERFTIFALTDISDQKRRRTLERIFFHDIMNTVSSLRLASRLLESHGAARLDKVRKMVREATSMLWDELNCQRDLAAAENNELTVNLSPVDSESLVQELLAYHQETAMEKGCRLQVAANSESFTFLSDRTLLSRVLGNMVKNAIEASEIGETATIGCRKSGDKVEFRAHNSTFMPREVQLQLFKRSFSTKGHGRGLGTYSMKLLSERYLQGTVSFATSETEGTTFAACYPLELATAKER